MPGCGAGQLADGLCAVHFNQHRIRQSAGKRAPRKKAPRKGTCTWNDCIRPLFASGLCAAHYKRRRNGRDMDAPIRDNFKHGRTESRKRPSLDQPAVYTERQCITCGAGFMSEGSHNRMCGSCRKDATGLDEHDVYC